MIARRELRAVLTATTILALAACGGAEEEPLPVPGPAPDPGDETELRIDIAPRSGPIGSSVTVEAAGFEPGTSIDIGFGPPQSEYEVVESLTAGVSGRVRATVEVPDWAEPGREYLFVAADPATDEKVASDPFQVREAIGDSSPGAIEVTGLLTDEGVECPALRTDQGELYTLAGETGTFVAGDRVTVHGTVAEMSICMQGTTITVERISRPR